MFFLCESSNVKGRINYDKQDQKESDRMEKNSLEKKKKQHLLSGL